jgi:hypothetical protein
MARLADGHNRQGRRSPLGAVHSRWCWRAPLDGRGPAPLPRSEASSAADAARPRRPRDAEAVQRPFEGDGAAGPPRPVVASCRLAAPLPIPPV